MLVGRFGASGSMAWLLLLYCAAPRANYLLRTVPPAQGNQYRKLMVPALYNVYADDWRMDPSLHNGTWTWFGCDAD